MASDTIERIKERLSIVDVVSPYVELQQAGKNFKGKSPFTSEKTPSFYVSPDRGMYYCFSSSQGGDIFTFIQKMEGVDFKEALKILAEKAGVELIPEDPKKKTERDKLFETLEEATKFFFRRGNENKEVQEYLQSRGLNAETIAKWRIGYAPGPPHFGWRELKEEMEGKGFTKDQLFKAGLIKGADKGKEPYDLFRDRVMFPIFDQSGRVVAYSGRILSKDTDLPKYVNSPETELFNKSEILYGYHAAKQGIRSLDFSLVVEGQFDVVLSHQAGYTNTVAVSGTALTPHHIALLQRLSNRVVLSLDADKAGIAAVKRAAQLMLPRGIDLKVANIVGGKDPADLVKEDVQKFKKIIGSAKHVIEYLLDILELQKKDDRTMKLQVREEILPLLSKIPNKIDQEHFQKIIAERLDTTKEAIRFEVERLLQQSEKPEVPTAAVEEKKESITANRKEELQQYLSVLCSVLPPTMQNSAEKAYEEISGEDPKRAMEKLGAEAVSGMLFKLETYVAEVSERELKIDTAEKLNELWKYGLREKIDILKVALREAEAKGDESEVANCLSSISKLQKDMDQPQFAPSMFA